MDFNTVEGTFEYNLKNAIVKMMADMEMTEEMVIEDFETYENFIELNPLEFGRSMAAVVFDFFGGTELSEVME